MLAALDRWRESRKSNQNSARMESTQRRECEHSNQIIGGIGGTSGMPCIKAAWSREREILNEDGRAASAHQAHPRWWEHGRKSSLNTQDGAHASGQQREHKKSESGCRAHQSGDGDAKNRTGVPGRRHIGIEAARWREREISNEDGQATSAHRGLNLFFGTSKRRDWERIMPVAGTRKSESESRRARQIEATRHVYHCLRDAQKSNKNWGASGGPVVGSSKIESKMEARGEHGERC